MFSLNESPLSPEETLEFILKSCRANIILIDTEELTEFADVIINNGDNFIKINTSTQCFNNINPCDVWFKIKNIFEEKE